MAAPAAAPAAAQVAAQVAVRVVASRRGRKAIVLLVVGGIVGVLLLLLILAAVLAAVLGGNLGGGGSSGGGDGGNPPAAGASPASAAALDEIPADYLTHYAQAAAAYGIDWAVLAGVGKAECDHGRSTLDGCNRPGTVNQAGARGPMQFLGSTWRASADTFDTDVTGDPIPTGAEGEGYATDGNGDGMADPWDTADATHAAARLLAANGAPGDYDTALLAYNRSSTYVADVLDHAANYRLSTDDGEAGYTGDRSNVPLSDVTCPGGGTTTVHTQLMPVIEALYAQATPQLCGSGHRSIERQIELREANGCPDIYESPASSCATPTARPGSSMHELGLAIDLTCDGTLINSQSNPCFEWLAEHAADYSLTNLASEPWHFSTTGR